ncbi:MAG TPA: IS481 family transposase [Pyrinomonadaceae bacterium]|nr:IS481 family transposase [Pyrinomonadaceae bacterium]
MPWQECSSMNLRQEFLSMAQQMGANFSQLCHRFGISRKTGYKWRRRYRDKGVAGLADSSRRPLHSPRHSESGVEEQVLAIRDRYGWGARKIKACLERDGHGPLAKSTVHSILLRYQRVTNVPEKTGRTSQRFEHERPNQLWQMDFKGHFRLGNHERCHPLTVLDDHSRYSLCLQACRNEQTATVKEQLTAAFRRYGLPERMLMDNGPPWGNDILHRFTPLTVWLLQLGIAVSHGRPYHPQTQGKEERFHRTLKVEVLANRLFSDFECIQSRFDEWRHCYNHVRPHEALEMQVPASRYEPSKRSFPEHLPPIEYSSIDQVRKVREGGRISFRRRDFRVGKAFRGYAVALRPSTTDGVFDVYFATHRIARVDLHQPCDRHIADH